VTPYHWAAHLLDGQGPRTAQHQPPLGLYFDSHTRDKKHGCRRHRQIGKEENDEGCRGIRAGYLPHPGRELALAGKPSAFGRAVHELAVRECLDISMPSRRREFIIQANQIGDALLISRRLPVGPRIARGTRLPLSIPGSSSMGAQIDFRHDRPVSLLQMAVSHSSCRSIRFCWMLKRLLQPRPHPAPSQTPSGLCVEKLRLSAPWPYGRNVLLQAGMSQSRWVVAFYCAPSASSRFLPRIDSFRCTCGIGASGGRPDGSHPGGSESGTSNLQITREEHPEWSLRRRRPAGSQQQTFSPSSPCCLHSLPVAA